MDDDEAYTHDSLLVFSQYGRLMLEVQRFEMHLAGLCLAADYEQLLSGRMRTERQLRKLLKTMIHLFQRASASEMRRQLEAAGLSGLALEQMTAAIKWRDRLAHRYLRQQQANEPRRRFKVGTYEELQQLTSEFTDYNSRLSAAYDTLTAKHDEPQQTVGELSPKQRRVLNSMFHQIIGGPIPDDLD